MNYYPFHIGDYVAHTAHLDPIEDIAYRRLMDAYYMAESALPADVPSCARLIRMKSNLVEVEQVLGEFFVLTDAGWTHKRCDAEIARMIDKSTKAKVSSDLAMAAKRAKRKPSDQSGEASNGQSNDQSTGKPDDGSNAHLPNTQDPIPKTQYSPNPPPGDSQGDEVVDADPADRNPTPQGAVCMAMKSVGISDVNPGHTQLLALLEAGTPLETFVSVARDCVARNKGSFRYVLSVVERQELEARDLAASLAKPKVHHGAPGADNKHAAAYATILGD